MPTGFPGGVLEPKGNKTPEKLDDLIGRGTTEGSARATRGARFERVVVRIRSLAAPVTSA
jgi:hypothetical protein